MSVCLCGGGGRVLDGVDRRASILVHSEKKKIKTSPLSPHTSHTHTPYLKMLRGGKCVPAPTGRKQRSLLSVSLDPIIQFLRHTCYLSLVRRCTHTHTHTAQVYIMKEGVWTAASPVWTREVGGGSAGHSPYVPHIPKIKPRRKIHHIPNQTRKDRRYWDGTERKKSTCSKVCERVCVSVSLCVNERPFSMLSVQLLLNWAILIL